MLVGPTVNIDQPYITLDIISHETIWLINCMNNIGERICNLEHKLEHEEKTMDSNHNAPQK